MRCFFSCGWTKISVSPYEKYCCLLWLVLRQYSSVDGCLDTALTKDVSKPSLVCIDSNLIFLEMI